MKTFFLHYFRQLTFEKLCYPKILLVKDRSLCGKLWSNPHTKHSIQTTHKFTLTLTHHSTHRQQSFLPNIFIQKSCDLCFKILSQVSWIVYLFKFIWYYHNLSILDRHLLIFFRFVPLKTLYGVWQSFISWFVI